MMRGKNRILFIILMSLLMALLFGLKDALILSGSGFPHLFSVIDTGRITFEESYLYLPYLNANIFELAVSSQLPMITLAVTKFIYFFLCFSNPDLYLLVMHIILPVCSFWLVFLIFKRYVDEVWALLLAFWGITFINNFSIFNYLAGVVLNPGKAIALASLSPLEITRTPFPSFSFFVFVLCFYLSTLTYKLTQRRYVLLSIVWALNIYVYLFNFVSGILFWLCYIVFTQYLSNKSFKLGQTLKLLAINIFVVCAVAFPLLAKTLAASGINKEALQVFGMVQRDTGLLFNQWGVFFSYLMPVLLVVLVIRVYCADYYELFYKFTPVFIMIAVELVILNLHIILGSFLQPHLFLIRIGDFFFRFLYFIPILYFFSMPAKQLFHQGPINALANKLHSLISNYVIRYRYIIAAIGILIVALPVINSNLRYFDFHRQHTSQRMNLAYNRLAQIRGAAADKGIVAVSDDIAVNLLIPIFTDKKTLFVNSFYGACSEREVVERLTLYARLYKWDIDRFLSFMLPNQAYRDFDMKNDFVVSETLLSNGFGYWLIWQQRSIGADELDIYKRSLVSGFYGLDLEQALKKYKIGLYQKQDKVYLMEGR